MNPEPGPGPATAGIGHARDDAASGLPAADQPGRRSGRGSDSVIDQMRRDQQRNSNEDQRDEDLPKPARDSTA